jgi:hypothetical protein
VRIRRGRNSAATIFRRREKNRDPTFSGRPEVELSECTTFGTFQGAELQGWFAPNITNDEARGVGRWSIEDLAGYLKTGHNRIDA